MECPHCGREKMVHYKAFNIDYNKKDHMLRCGHCGYWTITDSLHIKEKEFTNSNCFTLEFSNTSGDKGKFTGTKEEIHNQIDKYRWVAYDDLTKENKLRMIANNIDILKYGYQQEFKNNDYTKYEITIDNSLWVKVQYGIW